LVKVCGVTRAADALLLAEAGVDAVGVIFAPGSRRRVDPETAAEVLSCLPPAVTRVGVFASPSLADLATLFARLQKRGVVLDVIQLHGELPAGLTSVLPPAMRSIRALPFRPGLALATALTPPFDALLLDGPAAGSGVGFDWGAAAGLRGGERWVLAGGLRPDNVAEALAQLEPPAVDVASGVELAPGVKDPALVAAFMAAVRGAP
jgi:phosphoribosylanthranilate isomerase